jgi:SAM-dependent methyltransferase
VKRNVTTLSGSVREEDTMATRFAKRAVRKLLARDDVGPVLSAVERGYWALKHRADWSGDDVPHWYDHRIDRGRWSETGDSFWLDRGVLNRLVMKSGDAVLDVGCGDGFYEKHFYAAVVAHVDAIDGDAGAIAHAQRVHAAANVRFLAQDVAAPFPSSRYDVAVTDQCLQYLEANVRDALLARLAAAASLVCGSTVAFAAPRTRIGERSALADDAALRAALAPHFAHVTTRAVRGREVTALYFRASRDDHAARNPL